MELQERQKRPRIGEDIRCDALESEYYFLSYSVAKLRTMLTRRAWTNAEIEATLN